MFFVYPPSPDILAVVLGEKMIDSRCSVGRGWLVVTLRSQKVLVHVCWETPNWNGGGAAAESKWQDQNSSQQGGSVGAGDGRWRCCGEARMGPRRPTGVFRLKVSVASELL